MIEELIQRAWTNALRVSENLANKDRSSVWVECIAKEFRRYYASEGRYIVFSRGYVGNRKDFRLNEMLFDVNVIEYEEVSSVSGKAKLKFPKRSIWHVESEFKDTDSRDAIIDFSKLLMGRAANNLIILPSGGKIEGWAMREFPNLCSRDSNTWACFTAHPSGWCQGVCSPKVVRLWPPGQ